LIEISVSGEDGYYFVSVKGQSSLFNRTTHMSVPYLTLEYASVSDLKRLLNNFPHFQPGGYYVTKTGKKHFTEADKLASMGFKFARKSKCTYYCVFTLVPGQDLSQTAAEPQLNTASEPLPMEPISNIATPETPQPIVLLQTDVEVQQEVHKQVVFPVTTAVPEQVPSQPQIEQVIPYIEQQPYRLEDPPVFDLTAFIVNNQ